MVLVVLVTMLSSSGDWIHPSSLGESRGSPRLDASNTSSLVLLDKKPPTGTILRPLQAKGSWSPVAFAMRSWHRIRRW